VRRRRYVKLRSRLGSLAHAQVELVELSGVIGDVGLGCRSSLQTSTRPGKDEPHRRNVCCVRDPHRGEAVGPHNPWVVGSSPTRPTIAQTLPGALAVPRPAVLAMRCC
jgi:hypothetical protein